MGDKASKISSNNSRQVGDFYNETTDKFLAVYGEIIQAFRTNNVEDYLNYTMNSARMKDGEVMLDAGCGICGPAVYFAQQLPNSLIHACTISDVQVAKAEEKIATSNLNERVNVKLADYHLINEVYPKEHFDCVYFLESFGHSSDKFTLLDACWDVLKPGGRVYIKDLFKRESEDEWEQLKINQICLDIDKAYFYNIEELNPIISKIRSKGFVLTFIKVPEISTSDFEHLSISNDFQNLFNIGKIDSWDEYIFPIDFYEILAVKPRANNLENMHLYYMNK
jgi:ubiquinone/menaquinone biosynthesis C-methylase UbiE